MPKPVNKELQDIFIETFYKNNGRVLKTCAEVGVSRQTWSNWQKMPDFIERLEEARARWVEDLRTALWGRAQEKSDMLGIFFLKAFDPEMYDDNIRKLRYMRDHGIDEIPREIKISYIDANSVSAPEVGGELSFDDGSDE